MAGNSSNGATRRVYILIGLFFLWALAIVARLAWLQVVQYGDFVKRAERQQQRSIEVAPRRGIIYDRNFNELAMTIAADSIFAVPSEVADHATTARLLARVLARDPKEILSRLSSSRSFTWIERKVDAPVAERVRSLKLRGVYFQKESKRYYPKRELAAQVLGYVGLDDEGLGGIERAFDEELRGKPGKMLISVDARRRWFGRVEKQPEPGRNVVLTVDEKIQFIAERELALAMKETRSEAGTIVVQNPRTGEILALASAPSFNPNRFRDYKLEALKNRAVSDVYEPGSTFKVVTIAAALEEKLTRPSEIIDCQNGAIYLGRLRIRDHHPYGLLSVSEVMANSSGVGAIKLGLRVGENRLYHHIRGFGFGRRTGIELPGETPGLTRPVERWSKVSIGAISMGQEVGVSALQLLSMMTIIANDGTYVPPRVVAGTTEPRSTPQPIVYKPAEMRRVISPMTAHQLKGMLEAVVLHGTGKKAILDGYTAAGKTGTAQKTDPNTGAYHPWKHVASFAGFAPINRPAVTVLVILDSAQGLHQGGQIAAPVFARVAQQVLSYLNVEHDIEVRNPKRMVLRASARDSELTEGTPDRIGDALEVASIPGGGAEPPLPTPPAAERAQIVPASSRTIAEPARRTVEARPSCASHPLDCGEKSEPRNSEQAAPTSDPALPTRGTVVLEMEGGVAVPSFAGQSLRSAIATAQQAGLDLDAVGSGIAQSQSPPAGSRIAPGGRVVVKFAR